MIKSSLHIANINRALKDIKSNIIVSESQTVDLSLFFSFIFYFEKLVLEFSMTLCVTITNGHMTRLSITHQSHGTMEDNRKFWKE